MRCPNCRKTKCWFQDEANSDICQCHHGVVYNGKSDVLQGDYPTIEDLKRKIRLLEVENQLLKECLEYLSDKQYELTCCEGDYNVSYFDTAIQERIYIGCGDTPLKAILNAMKYVK